LQRCLGNQAMVHRDLGEDAIAMRRLIQQERYCRRLEFRESLQHCLGEKAELFAAHGDLDRSRELCLERVRICRELRRPETLAVALVEWGGTARSGSSRSNAFREARDLAEKLGRREFLDAIEARIDELEAPSRWDVPRTATDPRNCNL